jgi:outer membrane receptor for ferrienterochelin and colicins
MKLRVTIAWANIACACAAVLSSAQSYADDSRQLADLSLEQLMDFTVESVYGASRYEQRVTQAPSSISIVTAEEIRRLGHASFADVLRSVRGLYVTDDRNYAYLGIRGFNRPGDYNTRVLVLIDGHRLNDNIYDSGSVGRDGMLDVELIDRVEVIRGPSSSLYGSSAFFGVINVVTKRGRDIDGAELAQAAGSLGTYRTRATYGAEFANGVDWVASASHYTSDGDERLYYPEFDQRISDEPRARKDGLALGLDEEAASKFFTSMRYGGISASAYYSERSKQIPTGSFGAIFGEPHNRTSDSRGYADLALDGGLSNGLRYQARAFYDHYTYAGSTPSDYALPGDPPDPVMFRDSSVGEWIGTELRLTATLWSKYTFVAGSEYRANLRENQTAYEEVEPRFYYLNDKSSSDVLGIYSQVEAALRDDIRVTAGLRYDSYSDDVGSTLNPRIAAIYNPTTRSAVKLLYGEAFRAPNAYERYYFAGQQLQPALEPETIETYELVYEHYIGSHYRLNVSAYDYRIRDLVGQSATDDGDPYFANIDAVRAHGIEWELEGKFPSGVIARGSYTLQRAKEETTHVELTSSPRQLAKLNVSVPVMKTGMYSNLELQYHSSSRTLAGAASPSFVLTNLSFTTDKLWSDIELSASINNVFSADHVYPAAEEHLQDTLELNGRTFEGKLVVRF